MSAPPLSLNPVPVAYTFVILRFAPPLFVRVTSCVVDVPTVTFPKLTLVELIVSTGAAAETEASLDEPPPLDVPLPKGDPPPVVALLPNEPGFPL
jgi:hypothetical protein